MKHYLIIALLFSSFNILYAQTEMQEIDTQLKQSTEALKTKSYLAAANALQKAKDETVKLLNGQLNLTFPQKVGAWSLVDENNKMQPQRSMSMPSPPSITPGVIDVNVTRNYETEKKAEPKKDTAAKLAHTPPSGMMNNLQPRISVTISNNARIATNINNMHSGKEASGPVRDDIKPLKVKNYNALLRTPKNMKNTELSLVVGGAVIQIKGTNLEDTGVLEKIAEQMDFQKIKFVLGE